ncbi:hypothetical protein [Noviherbaspirillum denitrificans]|uniref:Glutelin n=1 Tax=Noviherbaspirillum denitrificans TaxID=1968433 RepID=A0A254TER0_9BURK|nr:hypothetical protein [Noviherbaspirillum denitrificans]OWW19812.1 hypothetical protein AYR66_10170 [Noviherbaspirillum denitrificans]
MNTKFAVATGLVLAWLAAMPAHAGGRVQWSVTVGSPGYVVPAPGVVVSPQPYYSYGPPPAAFAPPPVVYVQPAYPTYPPPVLYVDPYGRPMPQHRHRHRHDWDGWDDGNRGRWDYRR